MENSGAGSDEYAAKLRESRLRQHESERALSTARQELSATREMLSQSTAQTTTFQQKYARAKRLARELRTDIAARDEFYQQLLQEKDTEYNALVKTLKDRVNFFFFINILLFLLSNPFSGSPRPHFLKIFNKF